MNKKEAIELIKNLGTLKINDTVSHQRIDMVDKNKVLGIISQIHEQKKPVVPQFVADWYENNNYDFEYNLYRLCALYTERKLFKELDKWFDNDNNRPIETLVVMHKFGYEIEKERLYTARLKLISVKKYSYINREKDEKELFISDSDGLTDVYQTHFTQAELEELDIWDNPAFEIEEVEK